jgi:uracil permease
MNSTKINIVRGFMPNERPQLLKLLMFSLQILIAILPATIIVPLILGFPISTTILTSGIGTLCFILVTKGKVPLYFGSSFSFLGAVTSLMASSQLANMVQVDKIAIVTFGIVVSGFLNIAAGLFVKKVGVESLTKIITPCLMGTIAMSIGATLTANAIGDCLGTGNYGTMIALITLFAIILFSVYLKGFWQQISLLLGILVGVVVSFVVLRTTGVNLFRDIVANGSVFSVPQIIFPKANWFAVLALAPIFLATLPESWSHALQIDILVDKLAEDRKEKPSGIKNKIGEILIGDGVADIVSSSLGGVASTSYGEALSVMAITKVYSIYSVIGAAILAIGISFFTPFINALYAIPLVVIGGAEVVCFGGIIAQGIAIMKDKVDILNPKDLLTIAGVSVIAIGGQFYQGGVLPLFGAQIPCIAGAAIFGIVLNLLFSFKKD